jgi:hypothetical protein
MAADRVDDRDWFHVAFVVTFRRIANSPASDNADEHSFGSLSAGLILADPELLQDGAKVAVS